MEVEKSIGGEEEGEEFDDAEDLDEEGEEVSCMSYTVMAVKRSADKVVLFLQQ
jgi:hypothetical protein